MAENEKLYQGDKSHAFFFWIFVKFNIIKRFFYFSYTFLYVNSGSRVNSVTRSNKWIPFKLQSLIDLPCFFNKLLKNSISFTEIIQKDKAGLFFK